MKGRYWIRLTPPILAWAGVVEGRSGAHPHVHMLVVAREEISEVLMAALRDRWKLKAGICDFRLIYDVTGISNYLTKEITCISEPFFSQDLHRF